MMFRGTKANPDDAFSQTIAKNGGENNAFTSHDYTAFYEQIAKDRLPLAMTLEADRLANLDLSDAHVGPERDVVLEERRMRVENEPQALMGEQMRAALHLSHPYGRPVIGWSDEVRRIDRVSAQDFYDHHYSPNNAILVVVGDVSHDEVFKLAQAQFGAHKPKTLPLRRPQEEPPQTGIRRISVKAPAEQPYLLMAYRAPQLVDGGLARAPERERRDVRGTADEERQLGLVVVVIEVGGKEIGSLGDFEQVVGELHEGQRAPVRFFTLDDPNTAQVRVMRMDRRWFPARSCKRDDVKGTWPCKPWADSDGDQPLAPATTSYAKTADPIVNKLAPSLVLVNFDMPYSVSGITERSYYGTGLILDAERGLVLVDRNTVPSPLGDVRLTFSGTIEIPGRVEYVHPLHNLAVVSYDPKLIGTTPARAATLRSTELHPGEQVWAVGVRPDGKVQSRSANVASIDPVAYPLSRTLQFRDANLETIALINGPSDFDGVLVNKSGEVVASWASFAYEQGRDVVQENRGIPADVLVEMLPLVRDGRALYSLETELQPVPLASARKLGLTDEWVQRLEQHSPERRQVLGVQRLVGGAPAAKLLKSGDLILDVDGVVVNRFREVERAVQKSSVRLTVLRAGKEQAVEVPTVMLGGKDLDRIVVWSGAVLQKPHRALSAQRGIAPDGVFVAYFSYGSPATRYQLWAGRRIVEVDGQPISDLDAFVKAVSGREDRSSLRVRTVSWNGSVEVITLKLDQRFWPTYELRRTAQGWKRAALP